MVIDLGIRGKDSAFACNYEHDSGEYTIQDEGKGQVT